MTLVAYLHPEHPFIAVFLLLSFQNWPHSTLKTWRSINMESGGMCINYDDHQLVPGDMHDMHPIIIIFSLFAVSSWSVNTHHLVIVSSELLQQSKIAPLLSVWIRPYSSLALIKDWAQLFRLCWIHIFLKNFSLNLAWIWSNGWYEKWFSCINLNFKNVLKFFATAGKKE